MPAISRLYELNNVIAAEIKADGTMWFKCSGRGYSSTHYTWEPAASFEGGGITLSLWLEQTLTEIPVANDIEFAVSEVAEEGFMVKRVGKPDHEHEWLPQDMIPEHLIVQLVRFEADLDNISDTMEVDDDANATTIEVATAQAQNTTIAFRSGSQHDSSGDSGLQKQQTAEDDVQTVASQSYSAENPVRASGAWHISRSSSERKYCPTHQRSRQCFRQHDS